MVFKRLTLMTLMMCALLGVTSGIALAQANPVAGTVATAANGTISLGDGTSFQVNDQTIVIRVIPATAATWSLASLSRSPRSAARMACFRRASSAPSPRSCEASAKGQRPMDESNLMTNATIDDAQLDMVNGGELTISYLGTPDEVVVNPTTRIEVFSLGSASDVVPGPWSGVPSATGWPAS